MQDDKRTNAETKNNVQDQFDTDPESDNPDIQPEEIMKVHVNTHEFFQQINPTKLIKEINMGDKMEMVPQENLNALGVENLKKVVKAGAALVNDFVESFADDGKITGGDIKHFLTTIPDVLVAIPAIKDAKEEAFDTITNEEFEELSKVIEGEISFEDPLDAEFLNILIEWSYLTSQAVKNRMAKKKAQAAANG